MSNGFSARRVRPRCRSFPPNSTPPRGRSSPAIPGTWASDRASLSPICAGRRRDWTGDRREFIGRNGALADPAALAGAAPLSKKVGAGLDPCAAMRTKIELPPDGSVEVVFLLGEAASADEARGLIARYRAADLDAVEAEIARKWDDILGAVVVKTPDRVDGRHAQRLAPLPDAELPHLGALRLLPGERRLWISRSIAGRHGARRLAARR